MQLTFTHSTETHQNLQGTGFGEDTWEVLADLLKSSQFLKVLTLNVVDFFTVFHIS